MSSPGLYLLVLRLEESCRIEVGKLGWLEFPAGYYVYTGSAQGGLDARIRRHQSYQKKLFWHIDYLSQQAQIIEVLTFPETALTECELNRKVNRLPGISSPIRGFGSSDCRCKTHLMYFQEHPALQSLLALQTKHHRRTAQPQK